MTGPPFWIALITVCAAVASCNPFAPALEEGDPFADLLGDPTTVDGFFTNFRFAYELRDVSLYEPLLDSAFVFVYRDFDAQVDRQWGFAEDLAITGRLFRSAAFIELKWNQIIARDVTDGARRARVIRSFNLTVGIDGADVFRGDGNVNFLLTRPDSISAWRLVRWRDESEL